MERPLPPAPPPSPNLISDLPAHPPAYEEAVTGGPPGYRLHTISEDIQSEISNLSQQEISDIRRLVSQGTRQNQRALGPIVSTPSATAATSNRRLESSQIPRNSNNNNNENANQRNNKLNGINVRRWKRRSPRTGRQEPVVSAMPEELSQQIQSEWDSMSKWKRFKEKVRLFFNSPDVQFVGTVILGGLMVAVFLAAMVAIVVLI